jgi:DNA-binding transcriptional ArsR family regulator
MIKAPRDLAASELESALADLCERAVQIRALLAGQGARHSSGLVNHDGGTGQDVVIQLDWARLAEEEYNLRRARDSIFSGTRIFAEPAWDILLDLTIAEHRGVRLPTSSVCLGSGVPPTTILRWLAVLEEKGFVFRENDIVDGRRSFVRLADKGLRLMRKWLFQSSHKRSMRTNRA